MTSRGLATAFFSAFSHRVPLFFVFIFGMFPYRPLVRLSMTLAPVRLASIPLALEIPVTFTAVGGTRAKRTKRALKQMSPVPTKEERPG